MKHDERVPGSLRPRRRRPEIASILEPESIALIGAGARPGSLGTVVLRNLLDAGFGRAVARSAGHRRHR